MSILGVWYVSASLVLLAPRLPRLKEWAYAGLVINYTGAAASHIWNGDGAEKLVAPAISTTPKSHISCDLSRHTSTGSIATPPLCEDTLACRTDKSHAPPGRIVYTV